MTAHVCPNCNRIVKGKYGHSSDCPDPQDPQEES